MARGVPSPGRATQRRHVRIGAPHRIGRASRTPAHDTSRPASPPPRVRRPAQACPCDCHCGAIDIALDTAPTKVAACDGAPCRRYGVLWTVSDADRRALPGDALAQTDAWNGRTDVHRCLECGCVSPRANGTTARAIDARLLPPDMRAAPRLHHQDGAGDGDCRDRFSPCARRTWRAPARSHRGSARPRSTPRRTRRPDRGPDR